MQTPQLNARQQAALPLLFFLLAFTTPYALAFEEPKSPPCTAEFASGSRYYDLTSLRAKKDYEVTGETGRKFYINACGSVMSETWNLDKPEQVAGFFRGDHSDFSIGTVNTTLHLIQDQPVLVLTEGSPCPHASELKASSIIRFICDPSVRGQGYPGLVTQLPPDDASACAFLFEWRTAAACPTLKRTGVTGVVTVFASIFFVAFLVYIVGATAYNHLVLDLRGWEMLPRTSIFSYHDTIVFVKRCFHRNRNDGPSWGSWGRSGRGAGGGGYMAPEEQAIIGGSYADEDDEQGGYEPRVAAPAIHG
ncbi:hypothetical protein BOTBODRAFT_31456 [Botryobasidium botryosum FD-172 SS1]|uniref:Autophagy-related protein 27 n=1 Tax=Botryobasidium botryosum (strain FD-172 SS1) TaxID=930990 RepID=A0A067MIE9_BOTB1|nr:hypothetical protein BOTBODRAFT_31456 [Botryobasidium botryosum FD-172 SS1]